MDPAGNYHTYLYDDKASNKLGKTILLNKDFKRITANSYSHIMNYENGFYQSYNRNEGKDLDLSWGLLSKEGKELLPPNYEMIRYNSIDKLIFVKVDFPQRTKLPADVTAQNKRLKQQFHVSSFPTVLIVDGNSKVLGTTGYQEGGGARYADHINHMISK